MKTVSPAPEADPVVRLSNVRLHYRRQVALDGVTLDLPAGGRTAFIGPDGVGKSSLLALVAGARRLQEGTVEVLGGNMADPRHRRRVCPRIAYLPQGLGRNLYPTLSVFENVDFFGRLFGHERTERERRIEELLVRTGLAPFADRPAGQLSGGMKQKLGLCCSLIHDPELLLLDEPTTGVDPLARRQFWSLIEELQTSHPGMSVVVATAYMEEAARFEWLVAMDEGRVLATGSPTELLARTGCPTLESAFIALLPEERRRTHRVLEIPPHPPETDGETAIEASGLTMRFGDFVAVDGVSFRIRRGEIFGFLGSNGCGKTTTMKMLTGLLPASAGTARLFGHEITAGDMETRQRVGYMTQSFSLYAELTVRQNLELHARLFRLPEGEVGPRTREMAERFDLVPLLDLLPAALPLGQRQRLSLAVAMIHRPELLILDEPTSGVDPIARDHFWEALVDLSRRDHVTIFLSTHFMNEAERCDRVSLMHAGRVLASDTPSRLRESCGVRTLEEAFIAHLETAGAERTVAASAGSPDTPVLAVAPEPLAQSAAPGSRTTTRRAATAWRRLFSYSRREALELRRDPIRLLMAGIGSVLLLIMMGYGINLDVENLNFAVLDRDQTPASRDYVLNLAGSRYFHERTPLADHAELDQRMRSGELSLALEIPPGFGRDLARRRPVEIGAWIDGALPMRGETALGYVQAMHAQWLTQATVRAGAKVPAGLVQVETRFRYNPEVESLTAMVPAMIPLLLMLIPAMLTALSVVREKELGSIVNFYVTPVTRLEFLVGKQLPYIVLGVLNGVLLTLLAITLFGIPLKGSVATLAVATVLYVAAATAMGLLISTFMRSQVAAIFGTAILSILPAVQFSGLMDPVSSLEGAGAVIGRLYPTTHFLAITRGVFSKALGFADLQAAFLPLLLATPVLLAIGVRLLRKQEA